MATDGHIENAALGCITVAVVVFIIGLALAVWAAAALGIAWLVQWTAGGFGHALPYWPVVGAVVLAWLVLGMVGRAVRGGKS